MKRRCLAAVLLVGMLIADPAMAFDTAHHWEMTWNALMREGFAEDAIRVVILQNWLTDFYAGQDSILNLPKLMEQSEDFATLPAEIQTQRAATELIRMLVRAGDRATVANASRLHFDNLKSQAEVERYWQVLISSAAAQSYRFARQKREDPLAALTLLGITLHAVQDFYSHSTWVGGTSRTCTGTNLSRLTWFDARRLDRMPAREIITGSYESPDTGPRKLRHDALNKDHYLQPCWDQAYALAYAATRQWVRAFAAFISVHNPDLWDRCLKGAIVKGQDADALRQGLEAAYRVSEVSGHWQGPGLSIFRLADEFTEFQSTVSRFKSAFTLRSILSELSADLESGRVAHPIPAPLAEPAFAALPDDEDALFIQVVEVASTNSPVDLTCEVNDDMPFLRIGFSYSGILMPVTTQELRMKTDVGNCGQRPPTWRVIWFAPKSAGQADLTLTLWNEGAKVGRRVPVDPYRLDIAPSPESSLQLRYRAVAQECTIASTSRRCDRSNPIVTEGQIPPRARLKFFIERRPLLLDRLE